MERKFAYGLDRVREEHDFAESTCPAVTAGIGTAGGVGGFVWAYDDWCIAHFGSSPMRGGAMRGGVVSEDSAKEAWKESYKFGLNQLADARAQLATCKESAIEDLENTISIYERAKQGHEAVAKALGWEL